MMLLRKEENMRTQRKCIKAKLNILQLPLSLWFRPFHSSAAVLW